jgi:hypothetical protein
MSEGKTVEDVIGWSRGRGWRRVADGYNGGRGVETPAATSAAPDWHIEKHGGPGSGSHAAGRFSTTGTCIAVPRFMDDIRLHREER